MSGRIRLNVPARYVHTNLIAQDWRSLARFYQEIFGCIPVPPERDFRGSSLDVATGLAEAHLTGVHLRLPGYENAGPTLEIFNYDVLERRVPAAINRPGFGHIAFSVDDVASARDTVLHAGGKGVGDIVTLQTLDGRRVTWCYVTDPEGNVIELQSWSEEA
jgi:predicted enzyme related to lactoylglutathione lyase